MKSLEAYLSEYSESHQNPLNIKIHNICVPAIMWSLLGFAWTFQVEPHLTLAHLLIFLGLLYYGFLKNVKIVLAMAALSFIMVLSFSLVPALRIVSVVVFVIAWIGQFYGHKVEGRKPSFFKDLLFLLIGPIWVLIKFFPQLSHTQQSSEK